MSDTRPNFLILMTDQMQGRLLDPGHPCICPNLRRLAARGVRFARAYTPGPTCSPARASMMTGRLPHTHGVTEVHGCLPPDKTILRDEYPHFAQRLADAGYRTAYAGKWHVDAREQPGRYGWQRDGSMKSPMWRQRFGIDRFREELIYDRRINDQPEGYRQIVHFGVSRLPPERRNIGQVYTLGSEFLADLTAGEQPWCCFVSAHAPHDPFVAGKDAYRQYDPASIELPPNVHDDLAGRPALYRRLSAVWRGMTDDQRRRCAACYFAMVTEVDRFFGRLLDQLEASGQADRTFVIFTSDHGELLGAHGLYCKNVSAFEEIHHVPMLVAGPGVACGAVCDARVGLQDLTPTLLELAGAEPIDTGGESRSFAGLLERGDSVGCDWDLAYAENEGNVFHVTQRTLWNGLWKFVFNAFDEDELYNLQDDPWEMQNLASLSEHHARTIDMMQQVWRIAAATGDPIVNIQYPGIRVGRYGSFHAKEHNSRRHPSLFAAAQGA